MPSAPATSTYGKAPSPLQTSTGALAGAIPDRGCAHVPWCAAGNAVLEVNHSCGLHVGWIIDFVARNRLPAMYQLRENVLAGGLMSYGASQPDLFRRAAGYVDRILQGTEPANLPVEQPVKFDLAVNLKTAKALGLTIPETFLLRADEVIE